MVRVNVLKPFFDLEKRVDRAAGDAFEATEERAAHIAGKLPGYVTYERIAEAAPASEDLSKLTVAQLRALCAERGVEVPKGARKADIISLL